MELKYYLLHKPFDVLSQFTKEIPTHRTLKDCYDFPPEVYPVGRLDRDSEGLLILTNDNHLKHRVLDPTYKHQRTYLVQVENIPTPTAIQQLRDGVSFRVKKKNHKSRPAKAILLDNPPQFSERIPPIRVRKNIPTAWIELTLTEGKNRQVRRMCAAVGYPVLRLIRTHIESLSLGELAIGGVLELDKDSIYKDLVIKPVKKMT